MIHISPDDQERTVLDRRRALRLLGGTGLGLGVAGLAARGVSAATLAAATDSTIPTASEEIPDETGGPFPGDGTNGVNVLAEDGVVRSDITTSFGSATGVADGIPLTVVLNVQDVANGGNPLPGAAVYIWHCDAEGGYSLYSQGITEENYLRGVQEVDTDGNVTFTTIYPGCYTGRWPHIHFEVYETLAAATSGRNAIKTSQLAFPQGVSETVYADDRYPVSTENLERISLESDMVFGEDGAAYQMAMMSGDNDTGYTAVLAVGV
jgi:protocatechuate 3,4-dioxygenase beta subunit